MNDLSAEALSLERTKYVVILTLVVMWSVVDSRCCSVGVLLQKLLLPAIADEIEIVT